MFSEIYKLPLKSTKRTLLLDRDQTIIRDEGYFHDANSVEFLDVKFDFIELLYRSNIAVFIISNQSGIGRGIFELKDSLLVSRAIAQFWSRQGGQLNGSVLCPHIPQDSCECRKPKTAMLEMVLSLTGSKKSNSLFIGNSYSDSLAARNASIPFLEADESGVRKLLMDWI